MLKLFVVTVCAFKRFGLVCRWISEGLEFADDVRSVICIWD